MNKCCLTVRKTFIAAALVLLAALSACTSPATGTPPAAGVASATPALIPQTTAVPQTQVVQPTATPESPTPEATSLPAAQAPAASTPEATAEATVSAPVAGRSKPIVGMMGAFTEDFAFLKNWGVNTVHYYKNPGDNQTVSSVLQAATQAGLNLLVSVAKVNQFNDSFDLAAVKADPDRFFPDYQTAAGNPAFLGYWIVDEPCNPRKKSPVQAEDLKDLYSTVKAINPQIGITINFGDLSCLQGFVDASQPGWKLTDIAMFTITEKKLLTRPDYITEQAAIAASIKAFDPQIKILPQIAVLEFKQKGAPMTPAAWAKDTGLEVVKHLDSFDGLLYYSFHSYENVKFIGEPIADVKDNPEYASAFETVFAAAGK